MDLHDIKASAFARATKQLKTGGELSCKPVYSRVRFVANMGPTLKVFESSIATEAAADLRAFDYRRGAVCSAGGFGANTTASVRHTNQTTEGEVPNGGDALVMGFEVTALPLRIPGTTTNANTIADDSNDTSTPARDSLRDSGAVSSLQGLILDLIADAYVPYVQRAGKQKEYLGVIKWKRSERGFSAVFVDPIGWVWEKGMKLAFGFERRTSITHKQKASAPLFFAIVDTALDATTADATNQPVLQDVIVETIGARFDPGAAA